MKVRDLMSKPVVRIHADEPVSLAARTLTHYNIGVMPVCGADGKVCGVITDRDIVTRCLAADRSPAYTRVRDVMTGQVLAVSPDADVSSAAQLMASHQVRRLPVVENGRLCGMISLGDLANSQEDPGETVRTLADITNNISMR